MKKFGCFILTVCLAVSMAACSGDNTTSSETSESSGTSSVAGTTIEAGREEQVSLVRVNTDSLRVRAEASTEAEVYTLAVQDEYFWLVEAGSVWNKIQYDGKIAYVSSEFSVVERTSKTQAEAMLGVYKEADQNANQNTESSSNTEDGEA